MTASLNAAVFDYRLYYGPTTSAEDELFSYSANAYTYFRDTDFAYGVQFDGTLIQKYPRVLHASTSLLLGYDFTKVIHAEINGGVTLRLAEGSYNRGTHYSATILAQSSMDGFLEAVQLGITYKVDSFSVIENEKALQLFIGLGF